MRDRLPPLNWLRTFEAAARHLSFTLAAQELGMTQSAVSQQVKLLEWELGEQLFVRRPRALQLTDTGRNLLPTVETAFNMIAAGTSSLASGVDTDRRIDFHGNMAFTALWLTPRLPRFLATCPWAVLDIATSVWTSEYVRPYASVEVRYGHGRWEGVPGEILWRGDAYPVVAPDYEPPLEQARLLDVTGMAQSWRQWLKLTGVKDWKTRPVHMASTYVITMQLARAGAGMAMSHDLICADDVNQGRLLAIDGPRLPMSEGYYLIEQASQGKNEASKAFIRWLLEEMAEFGDAGKPAGR